MPVRRRTRPVSAVVAVVVLGVGLAACGGSSEPEQNPDEFTFCRLALANQPVSDADAQVWRRLDELAPAEVDDAVVVLREAAEELEELTPNSPEAIAAEFEIRFRDDYLAARAAMEAFLDDECQDYLSTTTTTSSTGEPTTTTSDVPTTTTTNDNEGEQ